MLTEAAQLTRISGLYARPLPYASDDELLDLGIALADAAKASKCGGPCVGFDDTIWSRHQDQPRWLTARNKI